MFSIGEATGPEAAAPVAAAARPDATSIVLRALRDMALLVAAGAALFAVCVALFPGQRQVLAMPAPRPPCCRCWGSACRVPWLLGHADVFALQAWKTALRTSFGLSALVAAAGSACLVWASMLNRYCAKSLLASWCTGVRRACR